MSSDTFYKAFCHSGSAIQTCECGRTFYCDTGDVNLSEKERADLKNDPRSIEVDDFTTWFEFAGQQIVFDCPCKKDEGVERLIWNNRHDIAGYLKRQIEENRKSVERDEKLIAGL